MLSCLTLASAISPTLLLHDGAPLRVAFGSCRKQLKPQPVWDAVAALSPALWLWLGDAMYPKGSVTSAAQLREAYAQAGEPALRGVPVDGVYDDHDYGLNDGGVGWELKEDARQLFLDEVVGAPADSARRTQRGGLYGSRTLGEPPRQLKVVMLDTRFGRADHAVPSPGGWSRVPKAGYLAGVTRSACALLGVGSSHSAPVLHEEQWAWLRTQLTNSTASAHLIVSSVQVLTSAAAVESWGHFPRERRRLLSLLEETRPRGALLLSGDVHYAELAGAPRAALPPGAELLEVTSSGLTHACGLGAVGGPLCGLQHRLFASHRLPTPHDARRPLPPLPPSAVAALRALGGPAAGAYPFLNFGSAELRWPSDPASCEPSAPPSSPAGCGAIVVRIHALDGGTVLEHSLPLGLTAGQEAERWRAAQALPTIFDAAAELRAAVAALAGGAIAAGLLCCCGCRRLARGRGRAAQRRSKRD